MCGYSLHLYTLVYGRPEAWLSRQVGFKGLLKKIVIFMIVAVGTLIDRITPATNEAVSTAICMYYIANEGLSILENSAEMRLPLPKVLKKGARADKA